MRTKRALVVAVLALAVGTGAYALKELTRPRFHAERFWQIRAGMTQAYVEKLLGAPPGNYESEPDIRKPYLLHGVNIGDVTIAEWTDDSGVYNVYYNKKGDVASTRFFPYIGSRRP